MEWREEKELGEGGGLWAGEGGHVTLAGGVIDSHSGVCQ